MNFPSISNDCCCKDYAEFSAITGLAIIDIANAELEGFTNTQLVFTAGGNGAFIRKVFIKAINQVTDGMVRLFVHNSSGSKSTLICEVAIPVTPNLTVTPIPYFVQQLFETTVKLDLKLSAGEKLYASTQNAEIFNVIAEGLNWTYPEKPFSCCNYLNVTACTGQGILYEANPGTDGHGPVVVICSGNTIL